MSDHHNKLTVCPNCATSLGPHDNFCPNCGQENHEVKLPLGHILYEFVESITHFDNKLWNSLKAIFTSPGKMTAEFLEGKRVRYVPPARLYVFVSVIFFFLVGKFADHRMDDKAFLDQTLRIDFDGLIGNDSLLKSRQLKGFADEFEFKTGISDDGITRLSQKLKSLNANQLDSLLDQAEIRKTDSTRSRLRELIALVPDTPRVSIDPVTIGDRKFSDRESREAYEERLSHMSETELDSVILAEGESPNWLTRKLFQRQGKFANLNKGETRHQLLHVMTKNVSVVMFILMPFVAVLLLLFYYRRGRFYYEHLIFSVHIHTVLFLVFSIVIAATYFASSQTSSTVFNWTFLVCWLYFLFSLKRVYQQPWRKTILKFFLLSFMYGITAVLFFIGALGIGLLTF